MHGEGVGTSLIYHDHHHHKALYHEWQTPADCLFLRPVLQIKKKIFNTLHASRMLYILIWCNKIGIIWTLIGQYDSL